MVECDKCNCEGFIEEILETISMMLGILCMFIFIVLIYRCFGKSRALYWFILYTFFIFDVATIGLTVDYIYAVQHGCSACDCDI